MASNAVEKRPKAEANAVDPADEPSAEWGWHGGFPRASRFGGWFTVFSFVIMLVTLDTGPVATAWVVTLTAGILGGLLLDIRKRRLSWRR